MKNNQKDYIKAINLYQSKNIDEALKILLNLHKKNKNDINSLTLLSQIYFELNLNDNSLYYLDEAIKINPNNYECYKNKSILLIKVKKLQEAFENINIAIKLNTKDIELYLIKISLLKNTQYKLELLSTLNSAISLQSNNLNLVFQRANLLFDLNQKDLALQEYKNCIKLNDKNSAYFYNIGYIFIEKLMYKEALEYLQKAIQLNPNFNEAIYNKSMIELMYGDYLNGYKNYESRFLVNISKRKNTQKPHFNGTDDIKDKTILIYHEQGLGDTIQYIRYAKLLKNISKKVIIEVPKTLERLFKNLDNDILVVNNNENYQDYDYVTSVVSLPFVLKTSLETIPNEIPYLFVDDFDISRWREKIGNSKKIKIGIVNFGNKKQINDINRSINIQMFANLLSLDFEFHYISPIIRDEDKEFLNSTNIKVWCDELVDFYESASFIMNLDIVISVCTSVAHLSASLGKQTIVLLPYNSDSRWMLDIDYSPWYPNIVKLFRHNSDKANWEKLIERLYNYLLKL